MSQRKRPRPLNSFGSTFDNAIELGDDEAGSSPASNRGASSGGAGSSGAGSSGASSSGAGSILTLFTKYDNTAKHEKDEAYPLSIVDVFRKMHTITSNPYAAELQYIVDPSLDLNEVVINVPNVYNKGSGWYTITRGKLLMAIDTNPPPNIKKFFKSIKDGVQRLPGYAYDDLIGAYLNILSRGTNKFTARDSQDFMEIVHPSGTGVVDEKNIKLTMYREKRRLFNDDGSPIYETVLYPAHDSEKMHWTLLCIHFEGNEILLDYLDSLHFRCPSQMQEQFEHYLYQDYKRNVKQSRLPATLQNFKDMFNITLIQSKTTQLPMKQEGVDCGFFVMEMAKYKRLDWNITRRQPDKNDMTKVRERIMFELKTGIVLKI